MNSFKATRWAFVFGVALSFQALGAGAIVVNYEEDARDYDYVMVSHAVSAESAAQEALTECREGGNKSCVVMAKFRQCGALALSNKFYRVGTGATSAQAMSRALAECPGCRIAQVACEDGGNEARLVSR